MDGLHSTGYRTLNDRKFVNFVCPMPGATGHVKQRIVFLDDGFRASLTHPERFNENVAKRYPGQENTLSSNISMHISGLFDLFVLSEVTVTWT